ncbi:heme acquisition protein HasR [Pseudomonas kuykendallii]|uniref:Heme acquisition protein HasR n=2 Tax=Pseudomonas kuykendallii TaxID=1007099 RepID=A0A1H2SBY8_9PSED|nr:heme acquisition protein HasR [Pseudomonas kuykendallii]
MRIEEKPRRSPGGMACAAIMGFAACGWAASSPAQTTPVAPVARTEATVMFDIPVQALGSAVLSFAEQSGFQVFFDSRTLDGLRSSEVQGRYTAQDGLARLLAGTPITYRFGDDRRVSLQRLANPAGALELGTLSVSAHADEASDWIYETPASVSVITREQMDKRPPQHAADMLVDTPGVTSAVNRQDPALSVNIRGMQDFGRVNMMIDGMRQNHVESGHQQRNGDLYIDSELLSEVVIEKGPSAGVHGANAIAGSADFRTLDYDDIILPGEDHGVRLRAGTGIGGYANGINFQGSAALAGRFDERFEILFARSEKSLGDYAIGNRGRSWETSAVSSGQQQIDEVAFSDQHQDSWLAKARWKIDDDQSLQLTYTGTDLSYTNTSSWDQNTAAGWEDYGDASAKSDSYAMDWVFRPDNPLIDLKLKLYYVSTENHRTVEPRPGELNDFAWDNGYCTGATVSSSWQSYCLAGMRRSTISHTDTLGLQLDNTSRFHLEAANAELAANYGIEWFQDEGKSSNASARNGVTTAYLDDLAGNNLNPNGLRDVASAFSSLTLEKGSVTLKAGLRYDWYHLRGKADVPGVESQYLSRLSAFTNYFCARNQNSSTNRNGCALGRQGDVNAIASWVSSTSGENYYTSTRFAPSWTDKSVVREEEVDRSEGRFSPFASASWKPLDWLELFANWGKAYRPPAMTETLWGGNHAVGSSATMYPNPLLDSERSTSWEAGFNILQRDLLKDDDRLGLKLAYFDTRVDNFMFTGLTNAVPGSLTHSDSNVFFVNNLEVTRFRGLELEANYDAGLFYGGVNATRYLGGENDFCKKLRPLGSQISHYDQPNEDGSMTPQHIQAVAAGYSSYEAMLDAQTMCGVGTVMSATRAIPMDRHGAQLGMRLLNDALDLGIRYNRSEGAKPSNWAGDDNLWDSYTTWDFYARYQVVKNVAVNLAVENIRDENYLSGYSDMFTRTYAPGRTVQTAIEVKF